MLFTVMGELEQVKPSRDRWGEESKGREHRSEGPILFHGCSFLFVFF